jgi:YgiT-type zinc finger domain-containing protein
MIAIMKPLKTCPICSGKRIRKVQRSLPGLVADRKVRASKVDCYECPDCGEHIYDPEAADKVLARPSHARKAS